MGTASSRQEKACRAAARECTRRCKEQHRLMKEAVQLRHLLAASHTDYIRSLTLVASSLSRFAVGEPLPMSDHTPPAVLAHRPLVPSSPPPLLRFIEQQRQQGDTGVAGELAATRMEVGVEELRTVVRHRSLAEVAAALEEYFLKVSVSGDTVSSLLDATHADFTSATFGSNSLLHALCCVSAPAVEHDRINSMNGGANQRHSSTLQQLLTWEKKLYREVKERERLQVQHDKKLGELMDQEYSKKIGVDVQKLKAAWDRSRQQLSVASLAVETSSSDIAELRDTHLARQLLGLCHATLDMWRAMQQHHGAQYLISQQLRGLSSRPSCEPTSEIHHGATRALESAVAVWCTAFAHMAKHQRDYVRTLHGWLKLTLTPVNGAEVSPVAAELTAFVDRWMQALERVHCADVLKSTKNFTSAIRALYALQSDELRISRRVKRCSRELDRKSRMLRQVEKSYYDSYVPVSVGPWHRGRQWRDDDRQVFNARNEVVQSREEIALFRRKVEDEMRRHAKAIDATRSAAVSGVQGTLPAVFQAMADFSASLVRALEAVCRQTTQVQ